MTDQEKEQFEFRLRAEREADEARTAGEKFEDATGVSPTSPLFGAAVGTIAGIPGGKVIEKATEAAMAPPARGGGPGTGGEKWARNWAGMNKPGTSVPEAAAAYQRAKGHGPVTEKLTQRYGPNAKLDIGSFKEAQRARPLLERATSSLPQSAQRAGQAVSGAMSAIPAWVGRGIAGGSAGFQGVEAMNRLQGGDYLGGAISGLGALGSGAALIPHPLTRAIGTAVGAGAPVLNAMIDAYRKREAERPTENVSGQWQGYSSGGAIPGYAKGRAIKAGLDALKPVDLSKLEGKTLIGTMSDRTAVDLARGLHGGPMFPTIHQGAAWAVDSPGAATRLINAMQAAGGPEKTVIAPMLMSPTAHRSNRDVSKLALKEFQENFGKGQFSPERLTEIEEAVRRVPGLAEHPGLLDPNAANMLDKMTFSQRGALVDWLGSKPKKAPAMDLGKLLRETTEPGIEGAELGAIGPSMFRLSGERSIDPSLHGSYSHILHGESVGSMPTIPREFVFRDIESKAMKELGRPLSDYNYRTSVGIPSQFIDDRLLRSWDELGYLKPRTGGLNNPE